MAELKASVTLRMDGAYGVVYAEIFQQLYEYEQHCHEIDKYSSDWKKVADNTFVYEDTWALANLKDGVVGEGGVRATLVHREGNEPCTVTLESW